MALLDLGGKLDPCSSGRHICKDERYQQQRSSKGQRHRCTVQPKPAANAPPVIWELHPIGPVQRPPMSHLQCVFAHVVMWAPHDDVSPAAYQRPGVNDGTWIVPGARQNILHRRHQVCRRRSDHSTVACGQRNRKFLRVGAVGQALRNDSESRCHRAPYRQHRHQQLNAQALPGATIRRVNVHLTGLAQSIEDQASGVKIGKAQTTLQGAARQGRERRLTAGKIDGRSSRLNCFGCHNLLNRVRPDNQKRNRFPKIDRFNRSQVHH